jgi:hypothetical protein
MGRGVNHNHEPVGRIHLEEAPNKRGPQLGVLGSGKLRLMGDRIRYADDPTGELMREFKASDGDKYEITCRR